MSLSIGQKRKLIVERDGELLRIATWNIERLRHKDKFSLIIENCEQANADILVLTETDLRLNLDYKFCYSTAQPEDMNFYSSTETRVTIYTNYTLIRCHSTFDEHTAVCVELKTEIGNMIVYGTIIGIYGNRHKNFMQDLLCQVNDIEHLAEENNLCVIGDFNCSFADSYYYTKNGRAALDEVFSMNDITLITRERAECIDHIAVSNRIIANSTSKIEEWNIEKRLSDHKGIVVELT